MHILTVYFEGAELNGAGNMDFRSGESELRKWTIWPDTPRAAERLRMLALICGDNQSPRLLTAFPPSAGNPSKRSLRLEFVLARHAPRDVPANVFPLVSSGFEALPGGAVQTMTRQECRHGGCNIPYRHNPLGRSLRQNIALAYGPRWQLHQGTDCFDFSRTTVCSGRLLSLFDSGACLTDPVLFLEKLHYRTRKARLPAVRTMELLRALFRKECGIDTERWTDRDVSFAREWEKLTPWQIQAVAPVLDAVRHLLDATPHDLNPLERPGVILWRFSSSFCRDSRFNGWIAALDRLFPTMQFVAALPADAAEALPREVVEKRLGLPAPVAATAKRRFTHLGRMDAGTVLLIDVDGKIPNVALMKLSAFYRRTGYKTTLVRQERWDVETVEQVFASCVFHCYSSLQRVARLRKIFGERLQAGGSGLDLKLRLPAEIENMAADYSLYSETAEKAVGFLTRGCPFACRFCLVPVKEGAPRQVSDFDDLLQGRTKLVLLDDNILSHPQAEQFLEEMAVRKLEVNFNQTLDLRLVDRNRAGLLRRISCRNYRFSRLNYHFSLNGVGNLDVLRRNYEYLGLRKRQDNVEFVCMYGFDATLAEDVERFQFLRSLPGAYVFVQEYMPIPGGPQGGNPAFFDNRAEELVNQLVKICFPQNMKSMEKYYMWLSRLYFERFGKLHMPLVDTIFRYNHRDRKGMYIARMESRSGQG
ncbi:MAG: hypothetical protein K0B01_09670 [Syntrophobacterales bacterium]|nr:hypothetical protein [Syntrophobacterales bacterium]